MAALADVGREISATLDPTAVLERIGEQAQALLAARVERASTSPQPDGRTFRAIVALGETRRRDPRRHDHRWRRDHRRRHRAARRPEFVNDAAHGSAYASTIPGTDA